MCLGAKEAGRSLKLRKTVVPSAAQHTVLRSPGSQSQVARGGRVPCGAGVRKDRWASKGRDVL